MDKSDSSQRFYFGPILIGRYWVQWLVVGNFRFRSSARHNCAPANLSSAQNDFSMIHLHHFRSEPASFHPLLPSDEADSLRQLERRGDPSAVASPRFGSRAASTSGCMCAGPAPSFCSRPSTNLPRFRSADRYGREPITNKNGSKAKDHHGAVRALAFKWIRPAHSAPWKLPRRGCSGTL